jgi:YVTN family beta-propeller protein
VTANNVSSTATGTISLPPSPGASITLCSGSGGTATYTYTASTQQFFAGDTVYVSGCASNALNGVYTVTGASAGSFSVANTATVTDNPELAGAQAKVPNAVFVNAPGNSTVYVAGYGTKSLYVINPTTDALTASVPVDSHPVAVAEAPGAQKVYVANQGSSSSGGSVSVVSTVSNTVAQTICLGGGSAPACSAGPVPVWIVSRADSERVYVLDQNGTIYTINTATDAVISSSPSAPGANFMFYDKISGRLYVTSHVTGPSSSSNSLSMFDASGSTPTPAAGSPITIPAAAASPCTTSAVVPTSVTVLGDGTRAYVASYQLAGGTVCTQLSVIDIGSGTLSKTIPLTQATDNSAQTGCGTIGFRAFAASSGGGANSNFKVYVSQCDAGNIAVVDTFPTHGNPEDSFSGVSLSTPLSTFPALGSGNPPPQNPVFLVPGP